MASKQSCDALVVLFESRSEIGGLLEAIGGGGHSFDRWIVCINGPDDGSAEAIRNVSHDVTIIERPDNPGFTGGMNLVLAESRARFVGLLNPDVRLSQEWLDQSLKAIDGDEGCAGVGGLLVRGDGDDVIDSAGFEMQPWFRVVDRAAGRALSEAPPAGEVLGLCAAAVLFRRVALDSIALDGEVFDEDLWLDKEDQDLCFRLRSQGWRLRYDPQIRAVHQRGWRPMGRRRVSQARRIHALKNRYLLIVKHWRWSKDWWRLPFVLVFELVQGLVLLFSEPGTLKGWVLAWRLGPRALAKRRAATRIGTSH